MRRKIVWAVIVAVGCAARPAGAHDGHTTRHASGGFPPLPRTASARALEVRERAIETGALGADHAVEHAGARALTRRTRRVLRANALGSGHFNRVLVPDNGLTPASVGGVWAPSVALPIVAINAIALHTGKILYFAYPWKASEPDPDTGQPGTPQDWDSADAYLFDPATGRSTPVMPPINPDTGKQVELFCAGASLLADGRVLITGGNVGSPSGDGPSKENYGLDTTYTFDPDVAEAGGNPWTTGPRMRQGRWYPAQVLLPDGRTVITSGQSNGSVSPGHPTPDQDAHQVNKDVEVFSPDGAGMLEDLTGFRLDGAGGRPPTPGQYPHMSVMPDGKVLTYGPFMPDSWLMRQPAPGATTTSWTDVPNPSTNREWAGGVQLPGTTAGSSKVLLVGGSDRTDLQHGPNSQALGSTTWFDESRPAQNWQAGPTLNAGRAFANTVLLPDAKIAVIGGGLGDFTDTRYSRYTFTDTQRRVEILDPSNLSAGARPVLGNAQAEGRTYHSTALLLPDGRVWSSGDDINGPRANVDAPVNSEGDKFVTAQAHGAGSGVRTDTAEVWSPPYLFNADGSAAARPRIVSAPQSVPYGARFGVRTRGDAAKAVLVAAGAATHANDMSQRLVAMSAPEQVSGRGVNLEAPSNANIAPPGYYMLFVLDADGTPSTATWVRIAAQAQAPPTLSSADPPTPDDAPPTPTGAVGEDPAPAVAGTPATPPGPAPMTRLKLGARFSLATSLARLRAAKRYSVVVDVDRPASVSVASAIELRRRVRVAGSRKRVVRRVAVRLAKPRIVRLRAAGAHRVRVAISAAGMRLLRGRRTATLRLTVSATPAGGGKAVTVRRRPVLR